MSKVPKKVSVYLRDEGVRNFLHLASKVSKVSLEQFMLQSSLVCAQELQRKMKEQKNVRDSGRTSEEVGTSEVPSKQEANG